MQAMRVFGAQKRYWILLYWRRASNWLSGKRKPDSHCGVLGHDNYVPNMLAETAQLRTLNRGSVLFESRLRYKLSWMEFPVFFPQSFQANFEISASHVSFTVFWHNFQIQGAGIAQSI